jgi:hypothetical protein
MNRAVRFVASWGFEALFVVGIIFLYQLTKWQVGVNPQIGLDHARDVIELEKAMGLFHEPAIHGFIRDETELMPVLRFLYINLHFPVTFAFL